MTQPAKQQYELVTLKAGETFPYDTGFYRCIWIGLHHYEQTGNLPWKQGEKAERSFEIFVPVPSDAVAEGKFAEWASDNDWTFNPLLQYWYNYQKGPQVYSTPELYQQFITETQQ